MLKQSLRKIIRPSPWAFPSATKQMHYSLAQLSSTSSDEQETISNPSTNHESDRFEVAQTLNSLIRQPGKALSFFHHLNEHGFSHDVYTYAAIVRILCYWDWERQLDSVLLEIIRKQKHLDFEIMDLFEALDQQGSNNYLLVRLSSALVKAYVSAEMFDETIDILFQTTRRGFAPHISSCNFLMNRLIDSGDFDMSIALYQRLKRLGLKPNAYTYSILIKALCKKSSLGEALDVFREMHEAQVTPNDFAHTTCIEGFCLHATSHLAYQLLKRWRDQENVRLHPRAYSFVIQGFCKEMKLEEADQVLLDAEEHGVVPDKYSYDALIRGYCKCGNNVSKALDLHEEMLSKGIKTNPVIVNRILQSLCQMGKVEEAAKLLDEMKGKQIRLDVINYTTVINGYCVQGRHNDALNLFEEMKNKGHEPDIVTYRVLAGSIARNGLAPEAIFNHLQGSIGDTITQNMIIKGLCKGGKVKEAERFFDSLPENCMENYAALIDGYCEASLTKKASKLFVKLYHEQGFLVTKASCSKLLSSLCNEGDNDEALVLLNMMLCLNAEPTKSMYSDLIGAFCQSGNLEKAELVFKIMINKGLTPDVVTYTMMINGYCEVKLWNKALDLFDDMKKRGIEPDVITYTVLLNSRLEDKKTDRDKIRMHASSFWSEMKKMGVEPDVVCYTVLIDRCCKTKNLEDAIVYLKEMIDRGLQPDNVTYTALMIAYCKRRRLDKVKSLVLEMSSRDIIRPDPCIKKTLQRFILKAKRVVRRA